MVPAATAALMARATASASARRCLRARPTAPLPWGGFARRPASGVGGGGRGSGPPPPGADGSPQRTAAYLTALAAVAGLGAGKLTHGEGGAAEEAEYGTAAVAVPLALPAGNGNGNGNENDNGNGNGNGNGGAGRGAEGAGRYDSLPDEDEPTGCTICLINRKGPCRPLWRRFERCMKDHEEEKEGDAAAEGPSLAESCDALMMPWIGCVQKYSNTYTLITNAFYQEQYIDETEDGLAEGARVLEEGVWSAGTNVNLTLWDEFVTKEEERMAAFPSDDEVEEAIGLARAHLLKEGGGEGEGEAGAGAAASAPAPAPAPTPAPEDPELVAASARIVLRDPVSGYPIDLAYVRDQDGNVLGFEQFTKEKEAMGVGGDDDGNGGDGAGEGGAGDEDGEDRPRAAAGVGGEMEKEKEEKAAPTVSICGFHIEPGVTTAVRVFALYREDVPDAAAMEGVAAAGETGDAKEVAPRKAAEKLYYSQAIPLKSVGGGASNPDKAKDGEGDK